MPFYTCQIGFNTKIGISVGEQNPQSGYHSLEKFFELLEEGHPWAVLSLYSDWDYDEKFINTMKIYRDKFLCKVFIRRMLTTIERKMTKIFQEKRVLAEEARIYLLCLQALTDGNVNLSEDKPLIETIETCRDKDFYSYFLTVCELRDRLRLKLEDSGLREVPDEWESKRILEIVRTASRS